MFKSKQKTSILTHSERLHARKIRLRWLIALSSLPLFGMVTAFGIAPQTDTSQVPIHTVVENLPIPDSLTQTNPQAVATSYWRDERVERGDTAASILQRLGVNDDQITLFLKSPNATHALIQIKSERRIQAQVTDTGNLIWLRHIDGNGNMLQIDADAGTFKVTQQAAQLQSQTVMKSGEIRNSLFGATDAAGIPDSIATQMADIFSTDIDFHQDLRRGDHFNVVYEVLYHNGEPVMTGRVLAAEFINAGHTYRAVFSDVANSKGEYYTPDGKPLKKAFLRSPLAFSRISSGFEMRFHPILKQWRQHKGIDYAAPTGTKVMAIADATVEFVGQQTGYGNFIVLRHSGNYSTAYGHLSAFAKGLHKGEKVSQGDVIGYVGMTGWATGPHLHYEFRVAGVATNPLTAKIPTAFPIAAQYMPKFKQTTQPLVAQLNLLDNTNLVAME
ncbi:MAG: peptidoglycan DD-metalloendopeptidase family protein [Sulfuriferula sp.]|nr:peptidoglycan DD-metalloendopeptidase family protein [Sulfuriferula sp.]